MSVAVSTWTLILISYLTLTKRGQCQEEAVFRRKVGKYLANYVIRTKKATSESECGIYCSRDSLCASVNYKTSGTDKGLCELNSKSLGERASDMPLLDSTDFNHLHIFNRSCKGNEEFSSETKNCKEIFHSCKDVLTGYKNATSGVYTLKSINSSEYYRTYCHMTNISSCGGGGWTLVMKLDGEKSTFRYNSPLWSNKDTYAVQDGLEGMVEKESKLASYWNTPFTKICFGMSHNGDRRWLKLNYNTSSLHSVFADGEYKPTAAGRHAWKSLIAGSSLQYNCNNEGFNLPFYGEYAIRIGFVANDDQRCDTCNSWIGCGLSGAVCENVAPGGLQPDNGGKNLKTFGYFLVQ